MKRCYLWLLVPAVELLVAAWLVWRVDQALLNYSQGLWP